MKIKGFQLRKNKKFYYKPRFTQEEEKKNFGFESKIRSYREASSGSMGSQWQDLRVQNRNRSNREINRRLIIIFIVLIIITITFFYCDFSKLF